MYILENKDDKKSTSINDKLVELLTERNTRKIISLIQHRPLPVSDIAKNGNISVNLTYRRIRALEEFCMLYVSGEIGTNGKKKYFYQSKIRSYSLTFTNGKTNLDLVYNKRFSGN